MSTDNAPLSPQAVANSLKVSLDLVYAEIKSGRLRAMRIGNRYRIRPEALADYVLVAEQRAVSTSQPVNLTEIMERRLRAAGGGR